MTATGATPIFRVLSCCGLDGQTPELSMARAVRVGAAPRASRRRGRWGGAGGHSLSATGSGGAGGLRPRLAHWHASLSGTEWHVPLAA